MDRRQFLTTTAGLALSGLAAPAIAQAKTKLRVGYLHTVAVDGQIWTGIDRGSFDKHGIDFELVERSTGPEVFEAMARGEVDVLSAGGVISNYLALGVGRAFLINDVEVATALRTAAAERALRHPVHNTASKVQNRRQRPPVGDARLRLLRGEPAAASPRFPDPCKAA